MDNASCHVVLQVKHKYNSTVMDLFRELFCWLPLAHVINKRVIVVHGGLFARDGVTLNDIRKIDRNRLVIFSSSNACPNACSAAPTSFHLTLAHMGVAISWQQAHPLRHL